MNEVEILEILSFNKVTGEFFWVKPSKYHNDLIGKLAGNPQPTKRNKYYWVIQINGKKYKRGHLVYFLTHGEWPKPCLDHINGNSLDDRPENLRKATIMENAWNHKSRKRKINLPMGVRVNCSGRFSARIAYKGKQIHLGAFDTPQDASNIYQLKRKELYGQFA
jgi:hypothetical protein